MLPSFPRQRLALAQVHGRQGMGGGARPLWAPHLYPMGPRDQSMGLGRKGGRCPGAHGLPHWAWPLGQHRPKQPAACPFQAGPRQAGGNGAREWSAHKGALGSATQWMGPWPQVEVGAGTEGGHALQGAQEGAQDRGHPVRGFQRLRRQGLVQGTPASSPALDWPLPGGTPECSLGAPPPAF